MSVGGLIGGIVGGIVGFFIGGPVGAAIGAGIGAGLGMILDPVAPDGPTPGEPGRVTVNTAQEGSPVPDGLGTVKFNANIIWSCCERSVEVKEEVEGGKGGQTQEVSRGFEYFLSWATTICRGPVTRLYTIYANDKIVWHGDLAPPASGGMVTISLDGMGPCDFYFGTDDQLPNLFMTGQVINEFEGAGFFGPILEEIAGAPSQEESDAILSAAAEESLIPAYRGLCYAIMKDNSLGSYNRAPSMFFVVGKHPSLDFLDPIYRIIETFDYNPAFAAYYILNKMTGLSTDYLDAADFNEAARILKGEGRGLSIGMNTQQDALTYLESILIHISAGLRWSGSSKLHLFLFRESAAPDLLPEFGPEEMLGEPRMDRNSWLATENEIKVQYSKRIFREPLCPTGCDGFEILLPIPGIVGPNQSWQMSISNPDWSLAEDCDDLSFLSDGLPENRAGTFFGLTNQGGGTYSFTYTSDIGLCLDQPFNPEECPTICGVRFACCACDQRPVQFDASRNPTTILDNDSKDIYWTQGAGPFELTVTGTDAWANEPRTLKTITTDRREWRIYTGPGCEGTVNVTVEDPNCEGTDVLLIMAPGQWIGCCGWLIGGGCGPCPETCGTPSVLIVPLAAEGGIIIRDTSRCCPQCALDDGILCPATKFWGTCGSAPTQCGEINYTQSAITHGCATGKLGSGGVAQWNP